MTRFVAISHDVIDSGLLSQISGNALKVWLVLERRAGGRGWCQMGERELARLCGVYHSGLVSASDSLVTAGLLTIEKRPRCRTKYFVKSLGPSARASEAVEAEDSGTNCPGERSRSARASEADLLLLPGHEEDKKKRRSSKSRKRQSPPKPKRFGEFWTAYPRKVGKDAASTAYVKAVSRLVKDDGVSIDDAEGLLVKRAGQYAQERAGEESKFTKHPASWLNAGRFRDEIELQPTEADVEAALSRQVLELRDRQLAQVKS